MPRADRRSELLRLAAGRLEPAGWRQQRKAEFVRPVVPGISARLDFAFSGGSPLVNVTPYVAVVHDGVEKARKFITGKPLYTLNEQIQKLMGDPKAHFRWYFSAATIDARSEWLVADCLEYAPPFYERFRSLDDITLYLEEMKLARRSIMKESLAIAYCLQGRLDEAMEALKDDIEAAHSNPDDIANEQLPKYAELFGLQFGSP